MPLSKLSPFLMERLLTSRAKFSEEIKKRKPVCEGEAAEAGREPVEDG